MDAAGTTGEMLSPGEAEWPPELRLPPPPPMPEPKRRSTQNHLPPPPPPLVPDPATPLRSTEPPPVPPAGSAHRLTAMSQPKKEPSPHEGFDDSHFLGSIMGPAAGAPLQPPQPIVAEAPVVVKRKRGRPRKIRDESAAAAAPKPVKKNEDDEVVCFICFDGGSLVVCDRRSCSKVYHPACIKRDESFFRLRGKWNCGWHICSSCEKAAQYMCYSCTYALCKGCIKQGKFFGVRGNKGFCDTCYNTILLIESKDEDVTKVKVDFDDKNSWEYLFKLYWLDLKGKHLLTLEELISAKSNWTVRSTSARREKEESSGERYDANDDHGASSDSSSRKRRRGASLRKRGRKRQTHGVVTGEKCEISVKGSESLTKRVPFEGMDLSDDTKWASSELLDFVGLMRNGDKSHISQSDVQVLLLEYIKQNNLRDSQRKSHIICDEMLSSLFRKPRVAHFEMLKLLDMHFHVKGTPAVNGDSQRPHDPDSAQVDSAGYSEMATKVVSDKRRKTNKKLERDPPSNLEDYAAIDVHNINLIYFRRSLMEDIIDDDVAAFSEKITGAFVRIRISSAGQKQDMYRLVKVLGTHKVAERYNVGKKMTDCALEISNLDKKEVITMDTISNQDFTEEECKRLRQSMKYDLVPRLKVGDICEKAKMFQSLQINDWFENEKQRLSHLRDRASETGRRKELRECVEKLQLLNTPEERVRRINEVPEVHVDPHMAPDYESAEEWNDKTTVDWTVNRNGSDLHFPGRKGTESNCLQFPPQKCPDASCHTSLNPPMEGVTHRPGAGSNINLQSTNGWNSPRPPIDLNNTAGEVASVSSSVGVSSDIEPEKIWHYRDPSGNVQGPFALSQLSKWTSYFPGGMKIWLTFESEENSLLLTEVLSQQPKDFIQPTPVVNNNKSGWPGPGKDRTNSSMAESISSPFGFNTVYSSGLPSQSADRSLGRDNPNFLGEALPSTAGWEPLKNSQTLHSQAQHQANYSCTIPSSAVSYGPPGSHRDGVPREKIGENNNCQETAGLWSPTDTQSNQSTMKPDPGVCTTQKQLQNDSKSNSGFVKNLNTQMVSGSQKVPIPAPQQYEYDHAISRGTSSPSEFKAAQWQKGTCWSLTAKPAARDEIQSSIASGKPEIRSPRNLSQPGAQFTCTSISSKTDATMNPQKACTSDPLNASANQLSGPKMVPVLSPGTQDQYPSLTPELERKQPFMNKSASTSIAPKDSAAKAYDHSSVAFVSKTSSAEEEKPQCSSPIALSPWGEPGYYQGEAVDSALWGVQDDPSNDMWSLSSPTPALQPSADLRTVGKDTSCIIEEVIVAQGHIAAGEMSPIPEGEKIKKGNSSASTGCGMPEQVKLKPSAASSSSFKSTEASGRQPLGSSLEGSTKASDRQPSRSSLEGSTKVVGGQPAGSFLDGSTKVSGSQPLGSFLEGNTKASGRQPSGSSLGASAKGSGWGSSLEGSTKASGWGSSTEGSTKASGWGSSTEGSTKASGWGSSTEGNTKASGWPRSSLSPDGKKTPGWFSSARESSKANSRSASQNRNSSSSHQTTGPTVKSSSEAPRRQGNTNSNSSGRGGAPRNNKSWHPSSGNRGSQSSQHQDRYSQANESRRVSYQGNESRRGSSNHSRRSDHRQDHGSGVSSRSSSSRGQPERGLCKYYESGHCRNGPSCNYIHR